MKPEQIKKLTDLSDSLKIQAQLPQNATRYSHLNFLADACTMLATGNKEVAEQLVELVQVKGDRVIEEAMLKFLKVILEIG